MKGVTEMLGDSQKLLGKSYDIQGYYEDFLSTDHLTFLNMLRVMAPHFHKLEKATSGRGRRAYENTPRLNAHLAKSFSQIGTNSEHRNRLRTNPSLRRICVFDQVARPATFSRFLIVFSEKQLLEQILHPMVREYHTKMLVENISRNFTAILV